MKQVLTAAILSYVKGLNIDATALSFILEQPKKIEHGDYYTNVAMQLAKVLKKNPMIVATAIVENLRETLKDFILDIVIVKPGFINFYFNWKAFLEIEKTYKPKEQRKSLKVVIEHTSINPNKAAHIGHLRNSCIGDMLARLYRFAGFKVEVHNYIDDLGNQLADTVVGLLYLDFKDNSTRFGDYCWNLYKKVNEEYLKDTALKSKREVVLNSLEEGHNNISWLGKLVASKILEEQLQELALFKISYDLLVWESDIVAQGFWKEVFGILQQSKNFVLIKEGKLAGCWILKVEEEKLTAKEDDYIKDKVLVRSNGILTYTAKDIAYHMWKFGLTSKDFFYGKFCNIWTTSYTGEKKSFGKATLVLNVIDKRQEYPQKMVKEALNLAGFGEFANNLFHISYGVVSLSLDTAKRLGIEVTEKASYAMSGRKGIGIKIKDFLSLMEKAVDEKRASKSGITSKELAAAAIRYFLLKFALNTEIVFDIAKATDLSGNTAIYLLYGYTRGVNILNKVGKFFDADANIVISFRPPKEVDIKGLHLSEYSLLRHLLSWHDVIENTLKDNNINNICTYAFELVSLFHNFYTFCPVLQEKDEQKKSFRLWLVNVYLQKLNQAFDIIGLPKPDKM